jgi:hypothetical protein
MIAPTNRDAVNCADFFTWPPNIFNPDCYAITWAKLFGDPAQKAAAYGATSPEVIYTQMPMPPAPGAPTGSALTVPPADGTSAAAAVDRILARQKAAWDAAARDAMSETAGAIAAAGRNPGLFGSLDSLSPTTWFLIGTAIFAVLLLRGKQ